MHLDAQSMRHAWHAELFADRLPVRAGVDPDALTAPSPATAALLAALDGIEPLGDGARVVVAARRRACGPRVRGRCPGWPGSTGWCCRGS